MVKNRKRNGFICTLCGNQQFICGRAYRPRVGIFRFSSVVECGKCGLLQAFPVPSQDDLDAFYRNEYREIGALESLSPYDDYRRSNARAASQAAYVTRFVTDATSSIIDVGCGYGQLLKALGNKFPQAELYGVEVSEGCLPILERLNVQVARTTLERQGRNPFDIQCDLFTCSHVLEHSASVSTFLSICRTMVKEGAMAMFEVPNCEYVYGGDMPHLAFFTVDTLTRALEMHGFEVADCSSSGPSIDRWLPRGFQRVTNFVNDHFPLDVQLGLRAFWRRARLTWPLRKMYEKSKGIDQERLEEEAQDPAWHEYGSSRSIAIRAMALRRS